MSSHRDSLGPPTGCNRQRPLWFCAKRWRCLSRMGRRSSGVFARRRGARPRPAPRFAARCRVPTHRAAPRSGAARGAGPSHRRRSGASRARLRAQQRRDPLRLAAVPLHLAAFRCAPRRSWYHRPGKVREIPRSERRGAHRQPDSTPAASTTTYSRRCMSLLAPTAPDRLVDARGRPLGLDERAIEAIQQGRSGMPAPSTSYLRADFTLPQKGSRWHLVSVAFLPPEGASRPRFAATVYPPGAGLVGGDAIDHGQVVAALGRQVWAAIAFDIDEDGVPVHLSAVNSTDDMWATQSMAFIREWRFKPALMDGKPVAARCVVGVTWGARSIDANRLAQLRTTIESGVPILRP